MPRRRFHSPEACPLVTREVRGEICESVEGSGKSGMGEGCSVSNRLCPRSASLLCRMTRVSGESLEEERPPPPPAAPVQSSKLRRL